MSTVGLAVQNSYGINPTLKHPLVDELVVGAIPRDPTTDRDSVFTWRIEVNSVAGQCKIVPAYLVAALHNHPTHRSSMDDFDSFAEIEDGASTSQSTVETRPNGRVPSGIT